MYNLYLNRQRATETFTQTEIETLAAATKCSTEKQTAQAILFSTFPKKEIDEVVEQLKWIVRNRECEELQGQNVDSGGDNSQCVPF